ncbi:hypothetical protein KC660_02515 [Candidatus Dojkabacteria bacterium]|uniref:Clostripain n=1 Tax=Candidatus Dojkabacteria bacterium TaxID=2099670 RepID=A0A955RI62_9BACT|nr:hypothetical protein [Candidatus Dojkabacteria bacterium]
MAKSSKTGGIASGFIVLILIGLGAFLLYRGGYLNSLFRSDYTTAGENKTAYVAVYVVGSSLEDDGQAGTTDMDEMVKGFKQLSDNELKNINWYVAFGGAKVTGWKGIKYATIECLIQDSANNVYGDDTCYDYEDPNANMASVQTYSKFLSKVAENATGYKTTYLINWDHGGDYVGYGQDSNYPDSILSLNDMKASLASGGLKYSVIGFDACLMAGLEVGEALHDSGSYLLASEETEPGDGWYYTDVVKIIANGDPADVEQTGTKLIDSYIDEKSHQGSFGKTLSLVNLDNFSSLLNSFNALIEPSVDTTNHSRFVNAFVNSEAYGALLGDTSSYSVDLQDMLNMIQNDDLNDTEKALLTNLTNAISSYVVYTREDGYRPGSYGVSIFNANNYNYWRNNVYTRTDSVSDSWYKYLRGYFDQAVEDNTPPTISGLKKCEQDGVQGACVEITDNVGIREVFVGSTYDLGQGKYKVYNADEIKSVNYKTYFGSSEDTDEFKLCTDGNTCIVIPIAVTKEIPNKGYIGLSMITVNGKQALLSTILNEKKDGLADKDSYYYYFTDSIQEGVLLPSRQQAKFTRGDIVNPMFRILDTKNGSSTYKEDDSSVTIGRDVTFKTEPATEDPTIFIGAVDVKLNLSVVSLNDLKAEAQ